MLLMFLNMSIVDLLYCMHCIEQVQEEVNAAQSFADIKFSNDGKLILAVVEGKVFVIDAFNGEVVRRFPNGASEGGVPMEATISADNKYILQGEP